MRIQKLLIIALVLGSGLNQAFPQTALSVRKSSSSKFSLTLHQKNLEDKADGAEAKAKESDTHAAVARANRRKSAAGFLVITSFCFRTSSSSACLETEGDPHS